GRSPTRGAGPASVARKPGAGRGVATHPGRQGPGSVRLCGSARRSARRGLRLAPPAPADGGRPPAARVRRHGPHRLPRLPAAPSRRGGLMSDTPADMPTSGRFEGREHRLPVRVYYEDTDFTGLVYHANYVRYFERGRSDALRLMGVGHAELLDGDQPMAFVVSKLALDYLKPARIDDALVVRTRYRAMR